MKVFLAGSGLTKVWQDKSYYDFFRLQTFYHITPKEAAEMHLCSKYSRDRTDLRIARYKYRKFRTESCTQVKTATVPWEFSNDFLVCFRIIEPPHLGWNLISAGETLFL